MNQNQTDTAKKERAWLLEEKYGGVQSDAFLKDLARLEKGEPLAYIIGWIPFLGTTIFLDSKPLIPRPETEFWTELVLARMKKHPNPRVLDLCAGSGAIGVAILKHHEGAAVDFGEIEEAHLDTIKKNVERVSGTARAKIIHTDLWSQITESYDFILTNPPYLHESSVHVSPSVRDWEPGTALFANEDGTALIKKIIEGAAPHLNHGGELWIEHDPEQAPFVTACFTEHGYTAETHDDQFGVPRVTRGTR